MKTVSPACSSAWKTLTRAARVTRYRAAIRLNEGGVFAGEFADGRVDLEARTAAHNSKQLRSNSVSELAHLDRLLDRKLTSAVKIPQLEPVFQIRRPDAQRKMGTAKTSAVA